MTPLEIVAVGASLGGLRALRALLGGLPAELGCSVLIAQHRRADPDGRLVELLGTHCRLPVIEPEDKTPSGRVVGRRRGGPRTRRRPSVASWPRSSAQGGRKSSGLRTPR